jgi:glycosyltransferase involved in cell wall biosynthesis
VKVLWIQTFFGTPQGWGSQRQYAFAQKWVAAGHSVDVVCTAAYDPSLSPGCECVVDGIRLHVSRAAYVPQMGFMRRCAAFLRFMMDAVGFVARRGASFDVLIASSGPLTNLIPALWGRLFHRLPYVFEVLDVWPDAAVEAGVLKSRFLIACSHTLERTGYRWASRIVTCSTGMSARVMRKLGFKSEKLGVGNGGSEVGGRRSAVGRREFSKVVTIAHGGDLLQPDRDACRRRLLASHGWPSDACVVLYMGALGVSNAVEDVAEAMRLTADAPGVFWVFAGSGAKEELVRTQMAHMRGAFLGKVTHTQMRDLCAAADINVVAFMHEPLFYENSPNKFFDGIAARLPTVFNRSTWLEPWLREYDCGIVCKGAEPGSEMARVIRELAGDPERRRRMGQNARRLAEEVFDRDKMAAKYLEILKGVAS